MPVAFLTSLALAGGAVATGMAVRRKPKPPLITVLINGEPKHATLLPPKAQAAITRAQQLALDLFGDTRQQQQQSLNITHGVTVDETEQSIEQGHQKNVAVATAGLGLATVGVLAAPIFYLPSVLCSLYGLRGLFKEAYHISIRDRRLDYRAVLAFSVLAAQVSGFFWSAAFGIFFAAGNSYLVMKTENRSKRSIADLFGGQVRMVWLLVDGVEVETPFSEVRQGDVVVVSAGQMMPVDGTITIGTATVDQHMLTGESQPIEKEVGDSVLASTVVLSGQLCVHVDKAGDMTVAAQITEMLSQTTDFKQDLESRTERWLNRITWPIIGLSALALPMAGVAGAVAVLWHYPGFRMTLFGPISMLSYLQVSAQRGILIKDGRVLEELVEVDTVVFDKTGTLTLEQPTVSRILCCDGIPETELLRYAAAAESKQSHPIALAIVQAAADCDLQLPSLEDAHYKVGFGLKVQIEGRITRVGSFRFMTMEGLSVPQTLAAQQTESHSQGHSLVLVALDDQVVGAIELQPTIRPEAHEVIHQLQARGVETVIISGDNDRPTRHLAKELGISRYFAEVLPEDKANLVAQLQDEGHKVCFVGDGINDSIALKTANVAISLCGATTIATDMAEIVFMDGTLRQLPQLFTLADEFTSNMNINLLAATLPGVIGIAGTFLFGWGMAICVVLMQTSTPVGFYNALKPLLDEGKRPPELSN